MQNYGQGKLVTQLRWDWKFDLLYIHDVWKKEGEAVLSLERKKLVSCWHCSLMCSTSTKDSSFLFINLIHFQLKFSFWERDRNYLRTNWEIKAIMIIKLLFCLEINVYQLKWRGWEIGKNFKNRKITWPVISVQVSLTAQDLCYTAVNGNSELIADPWHVTPAQ